MEKKYVCCLCGGNFTGYGNNPDGAVYKRWDGEIIMPEFKPDDRCCDSCNDKFVIPGRMYRMAKAEEEREDKK